MPRLSLGLPAIAALLFLSASPVHADDVIRLGNLKFAHYGAVSYLKEIGPSCGFKVEERMFAKGIDIMPAIVAGEIDIAASGLDAAIAGRAGGAPVYVVAGFAKGGLRLVGGAKSGIDSVAGLKGKKVGTARGGASELALFAELAKAGLTWSDKPGAVDVQILYMAYADLAQALMAGNIDAMMHSEPYASQAINKGFGAEILKPYDTPMGEPVRSLIMTEALYGRTDLAQRVLNCFVKATSKFIAEPALAEDYVRQRLFKGQLGEQDYRDAIGNSPFTYDITVGHVQITTHYMQTYGVGRMANPPAAEGWVKLDLLEKAKTTLGTN
jgi:NitT/TauT family transport system substrate-binding protein